MGRGLDHGSRICAEAAAQTPAVTLFFLILLLRSRPRDVGN